MKMVWSPATCAESQAAFQIRQRAMQHGRAMPGTIEAGSGLGLGSLVSSLRTRVVLGNCPLIFAEHVDAEAFLGVQVFVGARAVVNADQHQHRVERHRGESVGGHAMNFAAEVHRNDGHPGGEASHRLAEFGRIQCHCRRDVACNVSLTIIRGAAGRDVTSYVSTGATAYITMLCRCIIRCNVPARSMTDTAPENGLECASALAQISPGVPISRATALQLIRCSDADLPALLAAARAAKERFKPGVITYSRKVFIPLTNLCRDYCGYCTFRRDPGDTGAHTMTS